jgi:hypothetical protein
MKYICWSSCSCTSRMQLLLLLLAAVSCLNDIGGVEPLKIDSEELFIGVWKAKIWCANTDSGPYPLFPPTTVHASSVVSTRVGDYKNSIINSPRKKKESSGGRWGHRRRLLECTLSIHPNGTFHMQPSTDHVVVSTADDDSVSLYGNHATNSNSNSILPMRGRWSLETNPYCVTDRFYNDVVLKPYKRVQKKVCFDDTVDVSSKKRTRNKGSLIRTDATVGNETVLQHVQFECRCRLTGHFTGVRLSFWRRGSSNKTPCCYARGRLSHGIIRKIDIMDSGAISEPQQREHQSSRPWWKAVGGIFPQSKIAASFAATRLIRTRHDLTKALDEQDEDEFGY